MFKDFCKIIEIIVRLHNEILESLS